MKNCSEMNELISLYIDDELNIEERKEFEEHISNCMTCKKELGEIMQIVDLCRDTEEEELPQNFRVELHQKLLLVKEQNNSRNKAVILRVRYAKIFSSIAAGLLLIFLLKGSFNMNLFSSVKSNSSTGNTSMKAEAPKLAAAPESASAVSKADNNDVIVQFSQDVQDPGTSTQEAKTEIDRSGTNEIRTTQAPKLAASFKVETASNTFTNLTILVDNPEDQIDMVKSIATKNGGEEQQKVRLTSENKMSIQAVTDTSEIELSFLIPNIQYDAFAGSLNSNYGQSNIEPGALVSEDLTKTLDELITQSNSLDNEIKLAEEKNDPAKKEELDKLKADKENTEKEIDNIRLGTDFTNVTVILKKR